MLVGANVDSAGLCRACSDGVAAESECVAGESDGVAAQSECAARESCDE